MAQDDPFKSQVFEVLWAYLASVCSQSVVGTVLGCHSVAFLELRIESQNLGKVDKDG